MVSNITDIETEELKDISTSRQIGLRFSQEFDLFNTGLVNIESSFEEEEYFGWINLIEYTKIGVASVPSSAGSVDIAKYYPKYSHPFSGEKPIDLSAKFEALLGQLRLEPTWWDFYGNLITIDPQEQMSDTITFKPIPEEPSEEELLDSWDAYLEAHWGELLAEYKGKYVAIWNDAVYDKDADLAALAERVYKDLGYRSIFMPYIGEKRGVAKFLSPVKNIVGRKG